MAADAENDALYSLPLTDFVRERDALSKRLKDAGESERAAEVKSLAKPSVAAWAINQLARREKSKVSALLKAGERLRQEQAKVLRGDSPASLRGASEDLREETERLVAAARSLLSEAGNGASDATLARIRSTLQAGAVDETGRDLLERGRVTRELEPAGFDLLASLATDGVGARRPTAAAARRPPASGRRLEQAEAAATELRSTVRERAKEVARAEKDALTARRLAEEATRHLRVEQERLERAKKKLERAEDRLREAKNDAKA
jgi:hypothetical protein